MMKNEVKEMKNEKTEKSEQNYKLRTIVVPGEVIAEGKNLLPGEWTKKEGDSIVATRLGILEGDERIKKVTPISGVYIPRKGNTVIGKVEDITFNGWVVDINSAYKSFLPIMECPGFISKRDDLSLIYNFGDMMVAKVIGVKSKGVDLTTKETGLRKLSDGLVMQINSHKVPRVIGKQGSMVSLIKDATGCNVVVGQNGVVWIKGDSIEAELVAKETIKFITERSIVEGLTELVKKFLDENTKNLKKSKVREFAEEDNDNYRNEGEEHY